MLLHCIHGPKDGQVVIVDDRTTTYNALWEIQEPLLVPTHNPPPRIEAPIAQICTYMVHAVKYKTEQDAPPRVFYFGVPMGTSPFPNLENLAESMMK